MANTPEELDKGREEKAVYAVRLEVPGVVPVSNLSSFYPAGHAVPLDNVCRYIEGE